MLPTIERLRVIARRCVTGEPLGSDLGQWLGDSLQAFLSHRQHSLDAALGLRWAKGGVPWWLEEAIRERDRALRELASRFFDGLSTAAQAKRIRMLSLRYGASAWRQERNCAKPPSEIGGTPKEWLWRAFKSGAAMPLGERQLRNILAL